MDAVLTDDTLRELHPWAALTETSLKKTKPGDNGLIRPEKAERLNVCVGKESVHRAILIWDHILKAIEASPFKIRMAKDAPCRTIVTVDGEELSIRIKEKATRREHVPTAAEKLEMKKYKWLHGVPAWDYLPSGKLLLVIDYLNKHGDMVNQVTWTDSEKKRIEDRLASFADILSGIAKRIKESRARAEELHRQWQEQQRQRQEAARLQAEEEKRFDNLKKQISAWELACSIRSFVNAVREETAHRRGEVEPGSPLDKWLRWAEGYADRIDPIRALVMGAVLSEPTTNKPAWPTS